MSSESKNIDKYKLPSEDCANLIVVKIKDFYTSSQESQNHAHRWALALQRTLGKNNAVIVVDADSMAVEVHRLDPAEKKEKVQLGKKRKAEWDF